jgi:hypothetical protein
MLSLGLPPLHIAPFFLYNVSVRLGRGICGYKVLLLLIFIVCSLDHRTNTDQSRLAVLTQARHTMKVRGDTARYISDEVISLF